ncbi:MAG: GntR family transcriptional regulator [Propionibacteriaceae bacterium]|nr:GntR family transcriptional regulator [Propionibacteriaceae bacterium]
MAIQIRDDLRQRMASGEIAAGSQLPSEPECCEAYGVSRATVREAYRLLEQEGLTEVRPGTGRFVLPNVQQQLQGSVSLFASMTEFLTTAGFELSTRVVNVVLRQPSEAECAMLALAPTDSVVELERLRCGNGEILVHSVNVFDSKLIDTPVDETDWTGSVVAMFRANGRESAAATNDIQAVNLSAEVAKRFGLSEATAWLRLYGVAYDDRGRPLWFSDDYIRGDIRTFHVVERKADAVGVLRAVG